MMTAKNYSKTNDLYFHSIHIERRRLELALLAYRTTILSFKSIMQETGTKIEPQSLILTPVRSNIITIYGKRENIRMARYKLFYMFERDIVTMKMDVSQSVHAALIGKDGANIKSINEEIGCNVKFPDTNKNKVNEMDNTVRIFGHLQNVEDGRCRIRTNSPLMIQFKVTKGPQLIRNVSETIDEELVKIQNNYKVQLINETIDENETLVTIKGVQWDLDSIFNATVQVIDHFYGPSAHRNTPVTMNMQISSILHKEVRGHQDEHLNEITSYTKTHIQFPDLEDPNLPSADRSTVSICGRMGGVYAAKQLLIGCLPIWITFALPFEKRNIDDNKINEYMRMFPVNIQKHERHSCTTIEISGIERHLDNVYKARQHILDEQVPLVTAKIPEVYHIPTDYVPDDDNVEATPRTKSSDSEGKLSPLTPSWYPRYYRFQVAGSSEELSEPTSEDASVNSDSAYETNSSFHLEYDFEASSPMDSIWTPTKEEMNRWKKIAADNDRKSMMVDPSETIFLVDKPFPSFLLWSYKTLKKALIGSGLINRIDDVLSCFEAEYQFEHLSYSQYYLSFK